MGKNDSSTVQSLKQWRRSTFKRPELHQYVQKELITIVSENDRIDLADLVDTNGGYSTTIIDNGFEKGNFSQFSIPLTTESDNEPQSAIIESDSTAVVRKVRKKSRLNEL